MINRPVELELFYKLAEQTLNGIIVTDSNNCIIYVNQPFTSTTGYTLKDVYGMNPKILQSGLHSADFYKEMWDTIHRTDQWQGEIWNKRKSGEQLIEWQNIFALRDKSGKVSHYASIFSDITDRMMHETKLKTMNTKLEQLATHDALTENPNRRYFNETLRNEWETARRINKPLSLLMIDIDHFKEYNDTYGHPMGDECLHTVATALRNTLTEGFLARYGGEEFAIILPGTGSDASIAIAEKLLNSVQQLAIPHQSSRTIDVVTISIGCSTVTPKEADDPIMLLEQADVALYRAKTSGRNQVKQ